VVGSRRLPTAAARVRGSGHVRFLVDKVALGQVFFEYFGFPWQSHSIDYFTIIIIIYHLGLVR
jgi:hypothetical protein